MSTLLELLQEKQKEIQAQQGRSRTVKLENGPTTFRILPHQSGDLERPFFQDYGQHFIKNFQNKVVAVYICTSKTFGRDCEICNQIDAGIATAADPNLQELLKEAKSGSRYLLNVVKVNAGGKLDKDPVLLEVPGGVFGDIVNVYTQYKVNHGLDIINLASGYNLTVTRTGTGRTSTRYSCTPSPVASAIDPTYLAKAIDLAAYVAQESQDQMNRAKAAIKGLVGSTAPSLPASMVAVPHVTHLAPPPVAPVAFAPGVSTAPVATPTVVDELKDIDLKDINLDDLDDM